LGRPLDARPARVPGEGARAERIIIATHRTDELFRGHPLRTFLAELYRARAVQRLELRPFTREEVAGQLAAITGARVAAQPAAQEVLRIAAVGGRRGARRPAGGGLPADGRRPDRGPARGGCPPSALRRRAHRAAAAGRRRRRRPERARLQLVGAHDLPQALAACVLAGRAAEARWGFAEAQAHYERALEFWDRVPDAEGCTGVAHLTLSRSAAEAANLAGDHGRSSAL